MDIQGTVKVISETKFYGTNNFAKREMVITTDEQYPQMILIEFIQDKCDHLDSLSIGQEVKVDINIKGREWIDPEGKAKYFNSIQGWRIEQLNK